MNLPSPEDYSWLDNLTSATGRAQEVYEATRADWGKAVLAAKVAQERITMHHMDERALRPAERHDYVTLHDDIAYEKGAWAAYERARERYFRLLDELAEAEKLGAASFSAPGVSKTPPTRTATQER